MILQNSIALGGSPAPAAYQIERSLRFNSADSAYTTWTAPVSGNRKTWTLSLWIKKAANGAVANLAGSTNSGGTTGTEFYFNASDQLIFDEYVSSVAQFQLITSQVFRDTSAWYHLVYAVDTTQATSANRVKIYVNGAQVTAFGTSTYPSQNLDTQFNSSALAMSIGRNGSYTTGYFNGYITEVNFIDGQALTPSDFGETSSSTGVWIPKAYTGSYGQNGFYLPFNDNSTVLNLGRNRQTLTADPYFPYTTLLLNGNGTNGAQNNTFLDSSTNNFTVTRNGNTTQGTFSPFSQTGWSNFCATAGTDYINAGSQTAYAFGTGKYTIEFFVYPTAVGGTDGTFVSVEASSTGWYVSRNQNAGVAINARGAGAVVSTNAYQIPLNQWTHVVVTRNSTSANDTRIFINGVLAVAGTDANNWSATGNLFLMNTGVAGYNAAGYISNVRLIKGSIPTSYQTTSTTAGTTVFTPPSAALTTTSQGATATDVSLLICQDNRFRDASNNSFSLTLVGTPSVQPFSPFAPTAAYSAATNGGSGYFDGTGDYLGGGSQTAYAFGTGTFTVEAWVYVTSRAAEYNIAATRASAGTTAGWSFAVNTSGGITFYTDSFVFNTSNQVPLNAWTHIAVTREGTGTNQTKLYINGVNTNSTTNAQNFSNTTLAVGCNNDGSQFPFLGYISGFRALKGTALTSFTLTAPPTAITNTSLLLNFTNAGIIDATGDNVLETVGNAQISTTQSKWGGSSIAVAGGTANYIVSPSAGYTLYGPFTIEAWVYRNTSTARAILIEGRTAGGYANYLVGVLPNGTPEFVTSNSANYYNPSITVPNGQWVHLALVRNASNVVTFYVNGVAASTTVTVSGVLTPAASTVWLGGQRDPQYSDAYIDDFRISQFARYTGNFTVPAAQFAYNTADINVKQWVPNNFSVTAGAGNDSLVDSPTNYGTDTGAGGEVRGNYATLNPLAGSTIQVLSNGNLNYKANNTNFGRKISTIGMRTGKWYAEFTFTNAGANTNQAGVVSFVPPVDSANQNGEETGECHFNNDNGTNDGTIFVDGTRVLTGLSVSVSGDVIGVALDADANNVKFFRNGVALGSTSGYTPTNVSGIWYFTVSINTSPTEIDCNFGQRPFAYTAPSGFKALCSTNLPTPAIGASASTLASKNFDIALYTGNGSARSITGLGFQPDFVWIKSRSNLNWWHQLQDAVRGATKRLASNDTAAEATDATTLTAFNSDGFSLGTSTSYNNNTDTYVAWNWKANGAGSSNTAGSITSTVSANQTAGISVVTFAVPASGVSGTIGHGLGVTPAMIIAKGRGLTDNWVVWHKNATTTTAQYLRLNTTDAVLSTAGAWGAAVPNSTVFGVLGGTLLAASQNAVAYCFAEIAGFSRFGSYTGNGSTDGPFIFTGFRPRFVLIKSSSDGTAGNDWAIIDTARNTFNESAKFLRPNLSAAEGDDAGTSPAISIDILSNGFKVRGTSARINTSSSTYIFAAFGESPFNYSRAR